jgi:hypothetical protein
VYLHFKATSTKKKLGRHPLEACKAAWELFHFYAYKQADENTKFPGAKR